MSPRLRPRHPHPDGGIDIARELYARSGIYYLGPVRHGANIIHSKKPIRSIEDFRGLRIRVPGGMVAELFQAAGAKTAMLPGSEILAAMESDLIDATDYVGPAAGLASTIADDASLPRRRSDRLLASPPRQRRSRRSGGLVDLRQEGVEVTRLGDDGVAKFTQLAVPRWFAWANRDPDAQRVFAIHLDYMMSGSLGYVTPEMIQGYKLDA